MTPMDPSTFLESVGAMIRGARDLLRWCLDRDHMGPSLDKWTWDLGADHPSYVVEHKSGIDITINGLV